MLGTEWRPSEIENALYNIMESYEIGFDLYDGSVVEEIPNFFFHKPNVQWQLSCSEWPDMTGGVCSISFIDNGTLHMISFDYKKNHF